MNYYHRRNYLIPDALFTIRNEGVEHFFLLEMDRGTVSAKRMLAKYQSYYEWWKDGGCKRDFGITSIRILTVTVSQKRMENLRKCCYQVKYGSAGSALFWFTETKHLDVLRPELLLKRIWLKALPNDDSLYSLID